MTTLKKVESHPKQVSFKIYANFESNLESIKSYKGFYSKKYQDHILCAPFCIKMAIKTKVNLIFM